MLIFDSKWLILTASATAGTLGNLFLAAPLHLPETRAIFDFFAPLKDSGDTRGLLSVLSGLFSHLIILSPIG